MRRFVYGVAATLDGFIAGPEGEYDWIVHDPTIDFAAMFRPYDTLLMGRGTYEVAGAEGKSWDSYGQKWIVVSTTLKPEDHPNVTILGSNVSETVAAMKAQPGKDIWLFGGGALFRSLYDAGLVDAMEVALMPVMIGSGIPLLPEGKRCPLTLVESKALPSGILMLKYSIADQK